MSHRARVQAVAAELRRRACEALVVTHLPDVRYLTGFTGSNAALVILAGPRVVSRLFTDGRYTVQARQQVTGTTVRIAPASALAEACEYAAQRSVRCGFDRAHTTVLGLRTMRAATRKAGAGSAFFMPCDGLVAALRMVKDNAELQQMRTAAALTCELYESMLSFMEPGMQERQIAAELEHRARLSGASGMSFETIVASGQRSSMPHATATDAVVQHGDLLTLDFGIVLDGYCSDMTRTIAFGYPASRVPRQDRERWTEQRTVFETVLSAQQASVAAVTAGASCEAVDAAARDWIKQANYATFFTHSTGHGVGLEIHESPRIAKSMAEPLRAGMTITIEPGVYLPGRFGVRIEDTVAVTQGAAEILTPAHKGWIEL